MTTEGTFPKVDGDILYANEVNAFGVIQNAYSGTGFDATGSNTTASGVYISYFISPTTAKYIRIRITGESSVSRGAASAGGGNVTLLTEIKESGGTFVSIGSVKTLFPGFYASTGGGYEHGGTSEFIFPISGVYQVSGLYINAISKIYSDSNYVTSTFKNKMTTFELIGGY